MNFIGHGSLGIAEDEGGDLTCEPSNEQPLPVPPHLRHFLFIGGPFGPFSRRLGRNLKSAGARVTHVTVHGGDLLDWGWRDNAVFRGGIGEWESWIGRFLQSQGVSDIITYGDCGTYASPALRQAKQLGIARHVFELGYFRPDWVTLERNGVNGFSSLPREPSFYRNTDLSEHRYPADPVGRIMPYHVWYSIRHCLFHYAGSAFFRHFTAPWPDSPLRQAVGYLSRFAIDRFSRGKVREAERELLSSKRPFFLCTLQKPGDTQLSIHSVYKRLSPFIEHVAQNFAEFAPPDARLVFKAHPLDNGTEGPKRTVVEAAERFGLGDRLVYLPSGSLSRLTQKAMGVVTVNSTAGLAALHMGRPTITLGNAFYDLEGLTHQGSLSRFWTAPQPPDRDLFLRFRAVVMARTQINGSYYAPRGREMALPEATRRLLENVPETPADRPEVERAA
ncbi:MAG TPA: capsular biosynthesis protein [Alphaproteobacteria bacterium]|nr:capsular biosynthesis protein [Alphaproteobacteria bacterium]